MSKPVTIIVWQGGSQIIWLPVLWNDNLPIPNPEKNDVLVIGDAELSLSVTKRMFFAKKHDSRVVLSTVVGSAGATKKDIDAALRESFFLP